VEWTRERLASYGLSNVHTEPWQFGRGWELQKLTIEMIEPRYLPLIGYAYGWSAAASGGIVAAPVLVARKTPEGLATVARRAEGGHRPHAADDDDLRAQGPAAAERREL